MSFKRENNILPVVVVNKIFSSIDIFGLSILSIFTNPRDNANAVI